MVMGRGQTASTKDHSSQVIPAGPSTRSGDLYIMQDLIGASVLILHPKYKRIPPIKRTAIHNHSSLGVTF